LYDRYWPKADIRRNYLLILPGHAGVFAAPKKGVYKFLQYGYYLPETRMNAGIVQE